MGRRYVSFTLGSGRYCVPVDEVLQILRHENVMEIPKAPPFVEGVINLRGDVVPVVNLRERLSVAGDAEAKKPRIVVTQVEGRMYGLAVDEVRDVVEIDDAAVHDDQGSPFGVCSEFIRGIAKRGDSLYMVLDLPGIFRSGG
jgi:purine-binding chemotaxis protein CheW